MTGIMTGIMDCPPEILDKIMSYVEAKRYDYFFLPQAPLALLLRVCHTWKPIAERRIYHSISLASATDLQFVALPGADCGFSARKRREHGISQVLLQTLQHSTRLAALVRCLRLSSDTLNAREVSQEYVQLLRLCVNVRSVQLRGYHPDEARALVDVLRTRSLTTLIVSGLDRSGEECGPLCTFPQLLEMMGDWPDLRCLQFYNAALSSKASDIHVQPVFKDPCKPKGCRQLLTLELPSGPELSGDHLRILLSLCPSRMQKLHIKVSGTDDSCSALFECLYAWAGSLTDLRVAFPRSMAIPDSIHLSEVISQLTGLKRLQIIPVMIPAGYLSRLRNLRELFNYTTRIGLNDLAKVFDDRNNLLSLRILNCILPFDGLDLSTPYEQIEKMSNSRNITFTISTSRRLL